MLRLEIKMDNYRIVEEHRYDINMIYYTINRLFSSCGICKEERPDGTMVFFGSSRTDNEADFRHIVSVISGAPWFSRENVRWFWYGNECGQSLKEDAGREALYYYVEKTSVA